MKPSTHNDALAQKFLKARNEFPMLKKAMHGKPLVYLDSGATAQKPQAVIDRICRFYSEDYGTVHRAVYELASEATQEYCQARSEIQGFLGAAHPEEIIFCAGTTAAINLVAHSFGKLKFESGDEVLLIQTEHHSNTVPWQLACEEHSCKIRVVPCDENGDVDLDAYRALLNPKVKLVAFAHVANATGAIHPCKEMIAMAHGVGARVLLDGAQSAPRLPLSVQDLDTDFFVFSGHKAYGPTGIGVLYGKKELLEQMPPYQGGGDMIETVTFEKTTYNQLPLKFEAGTPMIAQVIGLGEAVRFIERLGREDISKWEDFLVECMVEGIKKIPGITVVGNPKKRCGLLSFNMEGIHPLDLGTLLDFKGIAVRTGHHCAQPTMKHFGVTATVRASVGLYNTEADVQAFLQGLQEIQADLP